MMNKNKKIKQFNYNNFKKVTKKSSQLSVILSVRARLFPAKKQNLNKNTKNISLVNKGRFSE